MNKLENLNQRDKTFQQSLCLRNIYTLATESVVTLLKSYKQYGQENKKQ